MDLYRFFHPHHSPRLKSKKLRLQELSELELATKELHRAIRRALLRMESSKSDFSTSMLASSSEAIDLAQNLIAQSIEEYPEDTDEDMQDLLLERKSAPGWEAWTRLLSEKLKSIKEGGLTPIHYKHEETHTQLDTTGNHSIDSDIKIKANA